MTSHSSHHDDRSESAGDSAWQAWLYVTGELPDAELADFERRLENDLALAEHVAEAVHLAELAFEAMPVECPVRPRPTGRRRAWIQRLVATAAALLVLAGSVSWFGRWQGRQTASRPTGELGSNATFPAAPIWLGSNELWDDTTWEVAASVIDDESVGADDESDWLDWPDEVARGTEWIVQASVAMQRERPEAHR